MYETEFISFREYCKLISKQMFQCIYIFGIKIAIYIKHVCSITLGTFTNVLSRPKSHIVQKYEKVKNENYEIFIARLIFHTAV